MPVPRPISLAMDCLKSAEFIQELKAETEKIVSNQNLSQKPIDHLDMVCLESEFPYKAKANHIPTIRRNVIPYPDHNYGQQPPLTPPGLHSPDPNEQTDTGNEDEDEEGVTRCICGFSHDDGYMICCDKCGSWQHIECMGIKSDNVPETYLCDRCEPRHLDVERARAIQARKKDQHSDDDGDDDTDTDEDSTSTSYTAISNTPTRITLTARPNIKNKGKSRLKNTSLETQGKRRKIVNRKRQRKLTRHGADGILHNDSNSLDSFMCHDTFQDVENCIYDEAVTNLKLQNTENPLNIEECGGRKFDVAAFQENRKGLVAADDIKEGEFITEYMGKVSLLSTFEERSPFFKRALPFVLYYNKIEQLELVIDARAAGNEARYIQRSCMPNSETQHVVRDGKIHVVITCSKDIAKGTHITIPFEYPLETYMGYVNCSCNQITCLVFQHNQRFLPQPGRKRARYPIADSSTRNSASENQCETDSDENEVDVGSGERPVSRRKTLSREERKLQAYVKQIEKMEKKEKKIKDPKAVVQRPIQLVDTNNTQSLCQNRVINGVPVPQSPLTPQARRISNVGPGSGKKRLSVSKKRTRISSCSSDPLSPDLSSLIMSTASSNTPVQESVIYPYNIEQNLQLRQKIRKDKEQFLMSMSLERSPALKDTTHKIKKDYAEAKAGSPTPPSTPGQLSPSPKTFAEHSLSIDVTSSLTSPSGNILLNPDRRNMLNGLLQIADQADNESTCSGSPLSAVATSNGMATSEEIMGDMLVRDGRVHTPSGRVMNRRLSKDCGYFGSLKKRWLVQYDGINSQTHRVNGCPAASLSSLISDYSIRRRAGQITASCFNMPKSCIPLKKQRLRAALAAKNELIVNSETKKLGILSTDEKTINPSPHIDRDSVIETGKISKENNLENFAMAVKESSKIRGLITSAEKEKIQHGEKNNFERLEQNFEKGLEPNTVELLPNDDTKSQVDILKQNTETSESYIERKEDNFIDENKLELKSEPSSENREITNNANSTEEIFPPGNNVSIDVSSPTKNNIDISSNVDHIQNQLNNSENLTEKTPEIIENDITEKLEELSVKILPEDKTMLTDSERTDIVDDLNKKIIATTDVLDVKGDLLPNIPTQGVNMQNNDIIAKDEKNAINESNLDSCMDASSIDVTNSIKINATKADSCLLPIDENSTKTESSSTIFAGVEARRLSVLMRDPRLSSSSSRSSRDSLDNVFAPSDSVSSLDDIQGPRLDLEKRSLSGSVEKLDGTPGGKKKMSLREYRNRKRTKPSSNIAANPSTAVATTDTPTLKPQQEPPNVLFTDTDALLTPRTLTLSTGLPNQHPRENVTQAIASATIPLTRPGIPLPLSAMPQHTPMPYPSSSMPMNASGIPSASSMMLHMHPGVPNPSSVMPTHSPVRYPSSTLPMAGSGIPPASSVMMLGSSDTLQNQMTSTTSLTQHEPPAVMHQGGQLTSNGPMFEPVSPGDEYMAEPTMVNQSTNSSHALSSQPYANYTSMMSSVRQSLPGSPCDAMDIEDEETASANKILVGMPNMDARKPYMQTTMQHYDRQVTKSHYHSHPMRGLPQGNKNIDNRPMNSKQSQGYNQQFRG